MKQRLALITDIQRSSVHDGPGFRTTVFFKGCQLNCAWCHNPETISFEPEMMHYPDKCIACGMCDEGCFSGAKIISGRWMTLSDVLREIEMDQPYYGTLGGVTFSGGEPLCQADFLLELLKKCKGKGIHAAMESNLAVSWQTAEPVVRQLDLMMIDLKVWNEEKHILFTGASNRIVRENLLLAQNTGTPLILRMPVVPGVNAQAEEVHAIANFALSLSNLKYFELLSYHSLGLSKAEALGRKMMEFEKPSRELMEELTRIAIRSKVPVMINGIDAERFISRSQDERANLFGQDRQP